MKPVGSVSNVLESWFCYAIVEGKWKCAGIAKHAKDRNVCNFVAIFNTWSIVCAGNAILLQEFVLDNLFAKCRLSSSSAHQQWIMTTRSSESTKLFNLRPKLINSF